jgi:cephalosporin hydroxylase
MSKIISREEFDAMRLDCAQQMMADQELQQESLNFLANTLKYKWIHQTNYGGFPCLQLPQDLMAIAEIIEKTRPGLIIEIGVAWGGGLLFYKGQSDAFTVLFGVDLFFSQEFMEYVEDERLIKLFRGSSIENSRCEKVSAWASFACKPTMLILDSNHTHDHVLQELRMYSPLVGVGGYIVVCDTVIEYLPKDPDREWGPGNNPKTAVDAFLAENDRFVVDHEISDKLLLTCNPGGYLKCVKD